jgi:hypothetical protein
MKKAFSSKTCPIRSSMKLVQRLALAFLSGTAVHIRGLPEYCCSEFFDQRQLGQCWLLPLSAHPSCNCGRKLQLPKQYDLAPKLLEDPSGCATPHNCNNVLQNDGITGSLQATYSFLLMDERWNPYAPLVSLYFPLVPTSTSYCSFLAGTGLIDLIRQSRS